MPPQLERWSWQGQGRMKFMACEALRAAAAQCARLAIAPWCIQHAPAASAASALGVTL